ncbi:MAG: DNA repair protein RecO [Clostridia bacterium]|nr:DNA repair protein RecO [Clostridia bacterium]
MGAFSAEGIVLRHADYRENDRMLTLLTPQGRVDALARGCKRSKSPLLPASEVFTLGSFELFSGKDRCVVVNCMITDSFYPLREDFDKLACAAYMANVCEAAVQPGDNAQKPFLLLARALGYLSYHDYAPRQVLSAFLLHFAVSLGYRPRLRHCVHCGLRIDTERGALFDIEEGGVVCPDCLEYVRRSSVLKPMELTWLEESLQAGVKGETAPEHAPLPLLQAYIEERMEKRIPKLMAEI